jgi:hypothetical protein
VKVVLRFWRNRAPDWKGAFRGSGAYLPDGWVWPAGTVEVPRQDHASKSIQRHVNDPYEWMDVIRAALEEAGIKFVKPGERP